MFWIVLKFHLPLDFVQKVFYNQHCWFQWNLHFPYYVVLVYYYSCFTYNNYVTHIIAKNKRYLAYILLISFFFPSNTWKHTQNTSYGLVNILLALSLFLMSHSKLILSLINFITSISIIHILFNSKFNSVLNDTTLIL